MWHGLSLDARQQTPVGWLGTGKHASSGRHHSQVSRHAFLWPSGAGPRVERAASERTTRAAITSFRVHLGRPDVIALFHGR